MRKLSMIISIILISIILSIPTYAGTKKSEEDQISIRINEYEPQPYVFCLLDKIC